MEAEGKRLKVTRALAKDWLADEGRGQVYREVANQWPGKIQRPTETDRNFECSDPVPGRVLRVAFLQ